MDVWKLVFSKRAKMDWTLINESIYKSKTVDLLNLIEINLFADPPPVKQLKGELKGFF